MVEKVEVEKEQYKLLHPKVAVLICSKWKKNNVMAAAWITPVSEEPPLVAVCVWKKGFTATQILKSREFTINIPTKKLVRAVLLCGSRSGKDTDKAKLAHLNYAVAKKVKAPIISDCAGHLECKVINIIDGGECFIFLGKIVAAYATKKLIAQKEKILLHFGGKKFGTPRMIN